MRVQVFTSVCCYCVVVCVWCFCASSGHRQCVSLLRRLRPPELTVLGTVHAHVCGCRRRGVDRRPALRHRDGQGHDGCRVDRRRLPRSHERPGWHGGTHTHTHTHDHSHHHLHHLHTNTNSTATATTTTSTTANTCQTAQPTPCLLWFTSSPHTTVNLMSTVHAPTFAGCQNRIVCRSAYRG